MFFTLAEIFTATSKSAQPATRRRCCASSICPAGETDTNVPAPSRCSCVKNPRELASSQTGSRGQDVRQASSTSAYGRGSAPIHSRRSTTNASTGSDITTPSEPQVYRPRSEANAAQNVAVYAARGLAEGAAANCTARRAASHAARRKSPNLDAYFAARPAFAHCSS